MQPYHNNFGKRLTKFPKLYFYDVGLVCSLLGIELEQLATHTMRGQLFETMVISDCYKQYYNHGVRPSLYFWRDHVGNEVDLIVERGMVITPVEIKAGYTITNDYFKGLQKFIDVAGNMVSQSLLVYAGDEGQVRRDGAVVSWRHFNIIDMLK